MRVCTDLLVRFLTEQHVYLRLCQTAHRGGVRQSSCAELLQAPGLSGACFAAASSLRHLSTDEYMSANLLQRVLMCRKCRRGAALTIKMFCRHSQPSNSFVWMLRSGHMDSPRILPAPDPGQPFWIHPRVAQSLCSQLKAG